MISWCSKKQTSVALSTVEVEYIATCSTSCEEVWLQKLLVGPFNVELEMTRVISRRDSISLYLGYGVERSSEDPICCDERLDSQCLDQAYSKIEVGTL